MQDFGLTKIRFNVIEISLACSHLQLFPRTKNPREFIFVHGWSSPKNVCVQMMSEFCLKVSEKLRKKFIEQPKFTRIFFEEIEKT